MDQDAIILFRELAGRPLSEREDPTRGIRCPPPSASK